eukprot:COSAG05_NODE_18329_length_310_cov_0.606635_1_plen_76_part_10
MDIGFSWVEPADNGGAAVLQYEVEGAVAPGPDDPPPDEDYELVGEPRGVERSFSLGGLLGDSTYCYRLSAINNFGR